LEKIVERIVILPQVVEVLRYVHEISEIESLGVGLSGDVAIQEAHYKEQYGITRSQLNAILVELKRLRQTQPALASQIDLLERYLTDFDKLAAIQRIVSVDKEKIVEKDVTRAVLVPTRDSDSLRNELSMSLLIEKLINEIKTIKKNNPSVNLSLEADVGLIFLPELYNTLNIPVGDADFNNSLKEYTKDATSKLQSLGGNWGSDHELMLNTILQERFAMGNIIRQANVEIERSRAISEVQGQALRERENQFLQASKIINETQQTLNELFANNASLTENVTLVRISESLNIFVSEGYTVKYGEPLRILAEFVGSGNDWNRLSSFARER
jgi:hypothetical protein